MDPLGNERDGIYNTYHFLKKKTTKTPVILKLTIVDLIREPASNPHDTKYCPCTQPSQFEPKVSAGDALKLGYGKTFMKKKQNKQILEENLLSFVYRQITSKGKRGRNIS